MMMRRKLAAVIALVGVMLLMSATVPEGLGQPSRRPALIFTGIANPDSFDNPAMGYRAVIFVFDRSAWRLINLPDQYENASWEYAGRASSRPRVWAIAQFGRAGLGPNLEIAYSLDDGRTWRHRSLQKISRFATFSSFSMADNGSGALTIHLENDLDSDHRGGYYTYTTTDGGRTWSRTPRHSQAAPPAPANSRERIPTHAGIPCPDTSTQNNSPD